MHENPTLVREPEADVELVVVMVHGRTQSPADMEVHADRLGLQCVRYVFPAADDNSWYPNKFMASIDSNEPALSAAIAHYEHVVSRLIAEGYPAERIVLSGFSQGACLTSEYIARHPRRYAGAIIWTGGLIGPKGGVWPLRPILSGMPAYLSTSEIDPWVPAERTRETHDWMLQSGAEAQVDIFPDRDHSVSDVEIAAGRDLIEKIRRSL